MMLSGSFDAGDVVSVGVKKGSLVYEVVSE